MLTGQESRFLREWSSYIENPHNEYVNPYYWVDDYPRTQGTHGNSTLAVAYTICSGHDLLGTLPFLLITNVTDQRSGFVSFIHFSRRTGRQVGPARVTREKKAL